MVAKQQLITQAGSHSQVVSLSLKREVKPDIRCGQPCGADTQTGRMWSGVSMAPKYQPSCPGCPVRTCRSSLQPGSRARSHFAVCGLFTVWVLLVSWGNIPRLAEPQSRKEKATPAPSVFLCISSYGIRATSGANLSGETKFGLFSPEKKRLQGDLIVAFPDLKGDDKKDGDRLLSTINM